MCVCVLILLYISTFCFDSSSCWQRVRACSFSRVRPSNQPENSPTRPRGLAMLKNHGGTSVITIFHYLDVFGWFPSRRLRPSRDVRCIQRVSSIGPSRLVIVVCLYSCRRRRRRPTDESAFQLLALVRSSPLVFNDMMTMPPHTDQHVLLFRRFFFQ